MLFAEPDYNGGVVIVHRAEDAQKVTETSNDLFEVYANQKLGVLTGTLLDEYSKRFVDNPQLFYYNSYADMVTAITQNKIKGFLTDQPIARVMTNENDKITFINEPVLDERYAYVTQKSPEGEKLQKEVSAYLDELTASGKIKVFDDRWFGKDESVKLPPDYSKLTGEKGTIKVSLSPNIVPFTYMKDNEVVGYDLDVLYHFCLENGYKLEVLTMEFGAVIPSIVTGKSDIGCGCITITEERQKSVHFTSPNYKGGIVMVTAKANKNVPLFASEFDGKKMGVPTGTTFDALTNEYIKNPEIVYYNTIPDMATALDIGKVDGFVMDEPLARMIRKTNPKLTFSNAKLLDQSYAFALQKSERGEMLKKELDAFILSLHQTGKIKEYDKKWYGENENVKKAPDYSKLKNEKGLIVVACSPDTEPFTYVKDNQVVGYDLDILYAFCLQNGYDLEVTTMDFGAVIPSLVSGKSDIAFGCITITEERAKSVLFTEPNYHGGVVIMYREDSIKEVAKPNFFASIQNSFTNNFIKEDRYKLILQGIWTTILISILSAIVGTILGFLICLMRRSHLGLASTTAKVYIRLIQGTPIVVLLMILYYLIFGSSDINAIYVAVIGFGLNFAAYVSEMIRTGIDAVDKGQTEAALALGFTKTKSFVKIVLPQAAKHFLPVYKGEFISLVKMTSVVGYITIQDLTKMSDIIRSRTYDAFFPLIVSAIIYFLLAWMLTSVLTFLEKKIDPKQRKRVIKLEGGKKSWLQLNI